MNLRVTAFPKANWDKEMRKVGVHELVIRYPVYKFWTVATV